MTIILRWGKIVLNVHETRSTFIRFQPSGSGTIPEGCQKVAGGRSAERRPPEPFAKEPRIPEGCQRRTSGDAWIELRPELRPSKHKLWHPCRGAPESRTVYRWSFRQSPERPPATLFQPSGLGTAVVVPLLLSLALVVVIDLFLGIPHHSVRPKSDRLRDQRRRRGQISCRGLGPSRRDALILALHSEPSRRDARR